MSGGFEILLFKVAVAVVVIWALYALLKWSGLIIPQPVWIILSALAAILLIYWAFQLFEMLK